MKLGASDKFFYYVLSGRSSIDIVCDMTFKQLIDLPALQQSADEALGIIPEFNKTIVVKNGKLEAVNGSGNVAVLELDDKRVVHFGSNEINGLLFYFSYKDRFLKFSAFHGLADAAGLLAYVKTVLYLYMKKTGVNFDINDDYFAKNFRFQKPSLDENDELYMPYEISGNPDVIPKYNDENENAFSIPEDSYDIKCKYIHLCKARLSLQKIIDAKNRDEVSLLPYLTDVVTSAIAKNFDCGDSPVVLMSGVDQRPMFGMNTFVNCSDSIFLPVTSEMRNLPEQERCKKIKDSMIKQLEKNLHIKLAGERVKLVQDFEANPLGVVGIADNLANLPSEDNFTPMTMVISNIGDMTLGDGLINLLDDFMLYNSARANYVVFNYFGDHMNMIVGNQNDSAKIIQSIVAEFNKRGIDARIVTDEHYYGDVFQFDFIECE